MNLDDYRQETRDLALKGEAGVPQILETSPGSFDVIYYDETRVSRSGPFSSRASAERGAQDLLDFK